MKYFLSILCLVGLTFSQCTEGFEEINTNPNAPIAVETEFLLRQVIYNYGEQMSYEGYVAGNLLGQYFTAVDFNLFDRHSLSEPQFGGNPWPILYQNLRDNEIILTNATTNATDAVYEGPARILKAYMTAALTDLFGDVPYSEALKGKDGVINPSYDSQETIYLDAGGILDNLNKGIAAIESYQGTLPLSGDVLYDGNLDHWISLANALKIKYLIRISSVVDVSDQLQLIVNNGTYISSNSENATFRFSDSPPNNFRMSTARVGDFNLFIMSETIQEILEDLDDPRIATYFRPTGNDFNAYQGLLNGPNASETSISIADYSLTGEVFREQTGSLQANFMTAWEVDFLLAEAVVKGYISGDANTYYTAGVTKAFDYWNVEMPSNYLTGKAALGPIGSDQLEPIMTQKWIANIINGYEGWIEYRRTGYPRLKEISASLNNFIIPVRMPYPTDEEALNSSAYQAAFDATNGNSINAKVWWDNQ